MSSSRHISVHVPAPATAVYAYAADPTHLPHWGSLTRFFGHLF